MKFVKIEDDDRSEDSSSSVEAGEECKAEEIARSGFMFRREVR